MIYESEHALKIVFDPTAKTASHKGVVISFGPDEAATFVRAQAIARGLDFSAWIPGLVATALSKFEHTDNEHPELLSERTPRETALLTPDETFKSCVDAVLEVYERLTDCSRGMKRAAPGPVPGMPKRKTREKKKKPKDGNIQAHLTVASK
jgi:hypothetical protein